MIDKRFGDLSYPIYLNHYIVVVAFHSLHLEPSAATQIASIISSIMISYLMMVVVESPLTPLRDRLRGRALFPSDEGSSAPKT